MTTPDDFELLELAAVYALNAVSDAERVQIETRVAAAPPPVAAAFEGEVRAVRETMAALSSASAVEPPDQLRTAVLALAVPAATKHRTRWRNVVFAAAAAIVVGLGAFGLGVLTRPAYTPTVAEQVMAAPDMRTVSGPLATGTATVMFSRDRNAAVLMMNNVPPPAPDTVYQMWLMGSNGSTSAGTMGAETMSPSTKTTLDDLGGATALAFTIEPGSGSAEPTGKMLAKLPLG
ncbi:anti-sigma factor [Mycobacterium vicinigordonae]|uniref:Anti-sigma-K factor RskA n=1 Tax=Mycobacterium vicinigordonae TaxID=1719132 RepID=A0A7D6I9Q5_9MYCO|nr:anti-sigma factor [Mycobacterium vicinigordonae]QLL08137.1 anti-sigma factor [Mycobacterium vicinigordonae]